MSPRLRDRVAVITGGASGMGRATAKRFLEEGACVVVGDINRQAGEETLQELGELGGARLRFVRCDVSLENDVRALVRAAQSEFGRLDVMFNNAGYGGAIGPLTEMDVRHWDETFAVLVRGVFLGIKHAARALLEHGEGGSIINTASIAGQNGGGGPQAYSAAKAAVISLTQNASLEFAAKRIRVNAICPGLIFTPLMHRGNYEKADAKVAQLQPWPRRGEGDDIAATAAFLASDDAEFITGQTLTVDGGLSATGTRVVSHHPNTSNLDRISGIAYGTTGRSPEIRRLD